MRTSTNAEVIANTVRSAEIAVTIEDPYNESGEFIVDVTGGGTKQVETATVAGTITGAGDVDVVVTAAGMTGTPKTIKVAVTGTELPAETATLIRAALTADVDVAALFAVSGATDKVILTKLIAGADDATLNIALANDTSTGLTTAATSANTTAGSVTVDVTPKIEAYDPISGKYYPILTGVAITEYSTVILRVNQHLAAATNLTAKATLPKNYRFTLTPGEGDTYNCGVSINGN